VFPTRAGNDSPGHPAAGQHRAVLARTLPRSYSARTECRYVTPSPPSSLSVLRMRRCKSSDDGRSFDLISRVTRRRGEMRETSADFLALVPDVRTSEIKSLSAENRDEPPSVPWGKAGTIPARSSARLRMQVRIMKGAREKTHCALRNCESNGEILL